jgi:hypothetical protein
MEEPPLLTNKGGSILIHDDFHYTITKTRNGIIYWGCRNRKKRKCYAGCCCPENGWVSGNTYKDVLWSELPHNEECAPISNYERFVAVAKQKILSDAAAGIDQPYEKNQHWFDRRGTIFLLGFSPQRYGCKGQ